MFSVLMKGSGYSMIAVATAVTYALLVAVGADAATYIVKASNGDKIQVGLCTTRRMSLLRVVCAFLKLAAFSSIIYKHRQY